MRLNFLAPPPIPKSLPPDLEAQIIKLQQCTTKEEVLLRSYNLLTKKYRGYRLRTFTRLFSLFDVDISHLWAKNGFLHCTNLNYLLEILLVGSLKFKQEDIRFKWTGIYFFSPHQYLQIKIDDSKWVNVDVWSKAYGIEFGNYAHGLHSGTPKAQ